MPLGLAVTTLFADDARVSRGQVLLHVTATGASETPLPPWLRPTALMDPGTGRARVAEDVGDLVRTASSYLRALAVLPTDREYEDRVDALIAQRSSGLTGARPLRPAR